MWIRNKILHYIKFHYIFISQPEMYNDIGWYENEPRWRRFDFHGLGLAIKQAREERGWTQAYLAELVGKTDRTIMSIENKGQHPSFNLFFQLVTMFDISVDQFFYTEGHRGEGSCRKSIDVMLNTMNEKGLVVMKATAEGLKKARETEVSE